MSSPRFITVEDARDAILTEIDPVSSEEAFLDDARGRFLAEAVEAPEDVPAFDNSSRDGFALRWSDLESGATRFEIVDISAAGDPTDAIVGSGEAVRISTGAKVPRGADTVVMQEHVTVEPDGSIVLDDDIDAEQGQWVRTRGQYLSSGQPVLSPGDRLNAAGVGLLASFGRSRVELVRRPRVAIVSTGDELVDIDSTPGDGQIINSNAHLLEALVDGAGGEPIVLPAVGDHENAIRDTYIRALESGDIVISSGGVSVGDHDLVRDIVEDLTGGMDFWKIRMKPGKPLAFGTTSNASRTPLIGLPGNPNSCFVCFHQFVRPALQVTQGADRDRRAPLQWEATLEDDVTSTPHRRQYLAGRLDRTQGTATFVPFERQASANTALFTKADAFGLVPEGVDHLERGDAITVEPIPSL